ncbi:OmpH family outer membrane protein [Vulgatibacter incomptus]|uniref:Outer membrane protein H n=1 Tax=Vulgatibacter incomptus TaxID=1391653 RepID=A0A0K1PD99_9BACT|nr:OmpH family outer membrane protein [Vulgatibacter incomptus]AKU91518.1 Outer membrane protein H precursor [Vulgatibacter incomptus]
MRRLLSFAVLPALLLLPAFAFADVKIGYVDLQRALNEVEEGQVAKARLKTKFEKSQVQLDKEQNALKTRKDELDKKRLAMDEATLRQKAEELDKEFMRVSGLYTKLQKELSDEERQATAEIFAKMRTLIAGLAEKEGFTFVLELNESGLLYGPPSFDLTNELVRLYNSTHKATAKK